MTRPAAALMVGLVVLLAVQAWPGATVAAEGLFADAEDGSVPFVFASPVLERALAAVDWSASPSRLSLDRPHATAPPALYLAAVEESSAAAGQGRHWSSLPFLGEQARQAGYELPLPFGVSVIYNYVARDIEVTDVRVGVDGAPPRSVSDVANFNARSTVHAAVVKPDVWLFPFLNVYALLGYIYNSSETNIQVTVPRPPPFTGSRQFTIKTETELEGFIGGGGLTLAGGYRQFFIMADVNYSQTDLGFDDRFRALVASARAGWNGTIGEIPLRLWAGGAYWDTVNTAKATTDVPGVGPVRFEADQGPKHPWNAVVGVSSSLHRNFELFAEYGFNPGDVTFFAGGLTIRF